jgi:hypothetical protein
MARTGVFGGLPRICAMLALSAFAALLLSPASSAEARKLALVIGNDAYEEQPALAKAVGDAHAMRATLEKLGFEVRLAENLDYAGMVDTLAGFQSSIEPGDTVAFHFSGHGVASNGRNFLLPVDFPQLASSRQGEVMLPRLAFDAAEIVDGLRAQGAALTLAVFDACRDNALTSGTRSVMSRGLVRMDPPRGVFVMFSAGPGELAADRLSDQDSAATSVFTRVFIPILETPGLTLVEIAKRTQVEVSELAATVDHQQFPDYSDRVIGDVVLLAKPESATAGASSAVTAETEVAAVAPTVTPPPSSAAPAPGDDDVALCDSVAGDPYDPLLPASVDRSRLLDLEWILDSAVAENEARTSPDAPRNPRLGRMPEAAAACEAALKRRPDEKRFAYEQTRALCLSGASEKCGEAVKSPEFPAYPSAKKFLAFLALSLVEDESAAGGLAGVLRQVHVAEWFGLTKAGVLDASMIVQEARNLTEEAAAAGDREAASLLLLFDETDPLRRIDRLQIAGTDGMPIGLAAVVTFIATQQKLTPEMRTLLNTAVDGGGNLARIMLVTDYEQNKTPENLQRAKEILAPAVAAGSPAATMVLREIEEEASRASTPAPSASPMETAPAPGASSEISFGDDASSYANNGFCDDRRFTGPGMTTTGLIGADVSHDATDCRTAFEAGKVTFQSPATPAGKEAAAGVDFGDDASDYANNGLCDDRRFTGPGMTDTGLIEADIRHDATDCRTAFEAERLTLLSAESASAATASADIAFGDDASKWANDGACDDSRFAGEGMTDTTLIEADIGHDATDCRSAFEAGRLTLR